MVRCSAARSSGKKAGTRPRPACLTAGETGAEFNKAKHIFIPQLILMSQPVSEFCIQVSRAVLMSVRHILASGEINRQVAARRLLEGADSGGSSFVKPGKLKVAS